MESELSQSSAVRSYRIRLRKLDSQSVIMGGFLPSHSTLQTLADEMAKLGHAEAGSFSIVLPKIQNRPSVIYGPDAFCATSLECCGLFENHVTLTLQRFVRRPSTQSWSPPAPLLRGVAPRGRIDSQKVRSASLLV
jgi:hypothetical protein